jgi:hypothetical protein
MYDAPWAVDVYSQLCPGRQLTVYEKTMRKRSAEMEAAGLSA